MDTLYEQPYPDHYPSEAADGTPHLTYFADNTSFVWSGSAERPVQVCPGGYGEPVAATFEPMDVPDMDGWHRMSPMRALTVFKSVCDQWLREHS